MSDLRKTGEATRRRVLGDAHVNRSRQDPEALHAPFVDLITDAAWGHVWGNAGGSGGIPDRERSMVTLAILAALGNWEEFELHLRATVNTGALAEDVREVLLHVAIYAGVPRANTAFRITREVLAGMAND
jgi:4-carboxymuconolactone decarboxylase